MNKDHERRGLAARFRWACPHPKEIEHWGIGLHLLESRSLIDVPDSLRSRLSLLMRTTFRVLDILAPKLTKGYRLNLFAVR
jgi:hypothetical protein